MRPQYAVQKLAAQDALRQYGLEKQAGRVLDGLKWLFSRHPNEHTYEAVGHAGDQLMRAGLWDRLHGRSYAPAGPLTGTFTHAGRGPGALDMAKDFGHWFGDTARDFVVGDPVTMAQEIKARASVPGGSLPRAVGQHMKDFYWHPGGGFMRYLNLGLTGYDLYSALAGDSSQRMGDLGGAAASALAAPFTARMGWQLGPAVQLGINSLGRNLGHRLDRTPQAPAASAPPATPPSSFSPQAPVPLHARNWVRSGGLTQALPHLPQSIPEVADGLTAATS